MFRRKKAWKFNQRDETGTTNAVTEGSFGVSVFVEIFDKQRFHDHPMWLVSIEDVINF